jgi:O-antigen/teichoic acid export membrane protein
MGYSGSVARGFGWLSLAKVLSRGLSFIKVALVARLMGPADFGLYGIIAMVIALFETITETGINIVLIRKQNGGAMLSTAMTISVVRGMLIALLVGVAAQPVAIFFGNTRLEQYILFSAIIPLIKGWINPALALFQKRLEFWKDTAVRTSVIFVDAVLGIIFVLLTKNIWGLLYGFVGAAIAEVALTWWVCAEKPRLKIHKEHLKELLQFSKWFNMVVISNYISSQLDTILIGRFLGVTQLGFYQSAYKIAHAPVVEVSDLASQSTFPVYSKIQDDIKRIMRAYYRAGGFSAVITGGLVVGLVVFREPIINLVFGKEWSAAIPLVPVLAVAAWIRSLIGPASAVLLTKNRPDLLAVVSSIRIVVLGLLALYLMPAYGLMGIGVSVLLANLASMPVLGYSMMVVARNSR